MSLDDLKRKQMAALEYQEFVQREKKRIETLMQEFDGALPEILDRIIGGLSAKGLKASKVTGGIALWGIQKYLFFTIPHFRISNAPPSIGWYGNEGYEGRTEYARTKWGDEYIPIWVYQHDSMDTKSILWVRTIYAWRGKNDVQKLVEGGLGLFEGIKSCGDFHEVAEMISHDRDRGCFIATSVFGAGSSELDFFRWFRDSVLLHSPGGKTFVAAYYAIAPSIACFLDSQPWCRAIVRIVLLGLMKVIQGLRFAGGPSRYSERLCSQGNCGARDQFTSDCYKILTGLSPH